MKIKQATLYTGLLIGAVSAFSFMNGKSTSELSKWHGIQKNTGGASAGSTGAPGESQLACNQCHSGSAQSGAGINNLLITDGVSPITNYVPGTTYNVAIAINTSTTKNGFQVVALTPSNTNAGSITKLDASTQILNSNNGRKYLTHTGSGSQQKAWTFTWTAPDTNVGEVTFYLATNSSNSNGSSGGDVIRLSQHTIGSIAGIQSAEKLVFNAGYNASKHAVDMTIGSLSTGQAFFNLVDLNGKSVYTETLGKVASGESDRTVLLPSDIDAGMYVVHVSVDNTFVSKKIIVTN